MNIKGFLLDVVKKPYNVFHPDGLNILYMALRNIKNTESTNYKTLDSVINIGNDFNWMYNEYRDRKLCDSYEYDNELVKLRSVKYKQFLLVAKFFSKEINRLQNMEMSKYQESMVAYEIEELKSNLERYRDAVERFVYMATLEVEQDKLITDRATINSLLQNFKAVNEEVALW